MVRLKHRYLLLNILYPDLPPNSKPPTTQKDGTSIPSIIQFRRPSSDKLTPQLLARIIRDAVLELFGDYGSGVIASSLVVRYLSTATSTAIVRVTRAHYRLVWAALSYITKLPRPIEEKCVVQVVRVSGTIKKAEEEAIRRARATILRATGAGVDLGKLLGEQEHKGRKTVKGIVSDDDEDDMDED